MVKRRVPRGARVVGKGLNSLTLDPSPTMRLLRRRLEHRNTVAEAWDQAGQAIRTSMSQVKARASR